MSRNNVSYSHSHFLRRFRVRRIRFVGVDRTSILSMTRSFDETFSNLTKRRRTKAMKTYEHIQSIRFAKYGKHMKDIGPCNSVVLFCLHESQKDCAKVHHLPLRPDVYLTVLMERREGGAGQWMSACRRRRQPALPSDCMPSAHALAASPCAL